MKKDINFQKSCLIAALIVMSTTSAFATHTSELMVSTTVVPSVYYCSGTTAFGPVDCPAGDSSQLLPATANISATALTAIGVQNPGTVGAIMGGDTPNILWSYVMGSAASVEGLAVSANATLTGTQTPGNSMAVSTYYVPCGTTPNDDGQLTTTPAGVLLGTTATNIQNTTSNAQACNTGGNIYFTVNPKKALNANGFVTPDTYSGDIDLTMQALSG